MFLQKEWKLHLALFCFTLAFALYASLVSYKDYLTNIPAYTVAQ
jgi:hypothetical protein